LNHNFVTNNYTDMNGRNSHNEPDPIRKFISDCIDFAINVLVPFVIVCYLVILLLSFLQ
jgi:hypothetical protein